METNPHFRNCTLCEAMCGIEITTASDGRLDIKGDKNDPFSRGYICPKAVALQDLHYDKDRLTRPVKKTSAGWQELAWDEAFDEVAHNLKTVSAKHGRNSVATYLGNPSVHNYGTLLFAPGFIRSLHTRNRFSATSVDQLAHHVASYLMFGHQLLLPIPDIDRTKFFLILGANPSVSNGSLMTAPGMSRRLEEIRQRGGKVILVDPRANETARFANRHLFIRPGTDVFLLLSLLNVLFEQRVNRSPAYIKNIDTIREIVSEFSPEQVASITGIKASDIRWLAQEFIAADSAICYGRIGLSTQEFGGVCQWLINVLNIVTGNFDRAGGAMFTLPAFDPINAPESLAPRGSFGRWRSRVRNLPEFAGELPVVALAEEILTDGEGQIRALVTVAGNPVLSTPNGTQLGQALDSLEYMVSIDPYINETTSHANIILPPASILERGHYDLALHLLAVRNTAKFSSPMFERSADARHDWEILLELQTRMKGNGVAERVKRSVVSGFLGPERMLDLGLRFGPYGAKLNPFSKGLTLGRLKKAVHGIDLGPLKPCMPGRLKTSDKQIDLAPKVFVQDIDRVKLKLSSTSSANGHLLLIGRRQLRSNNSWMHNSHRLVRSNSTKPDCTVLMHPLDAANRDIRDGQKVKVKSRVGEIVLLVEVSDEMMRGVVSIPHGWGHDRKGNRLEVAQRNPGASINDLTDNQAIDVVCGTAAFNGTPVTVESIVESV